MIWTPLFLLNIYSSLRAITQLRHPDIYFTEEDFLTDEIDIYIHAIQSKATTPEEQALGHFTRQELKTMDTWKEWELGEHKQLNQFECLGMYGTPINRPKDAVVLRPHWQYHIKRCGTHQARQCCDGSKRAAPMLYMHLILPIPLMWNILFRDSSLTLLQIRTLESMEEMQRMPMLIPQDLKLKLLCP